jgi:hypothetical protein
VRPGWPRSKRGIEVNGESCVERQIVSRDTRQVNLVVPSACTLPNESSFRKQSLMPNRRWSEVSTVRPQVQHLQQPGFRRMGNIEHRHFSRLVHGNEKPPAIFCDAHQLRPTAFRDSAEIVHRPRRALRLASHRSIDILPAASGEDSYGLLLFLQDDFGGFNSHNHLTSAEDHEEASLLGCPPIGLATGRMKTQNCAFYPRSEDRGFTAHLGKACRTTFLRCNRAPPYLRESISRRLFHRHREFRWSATFPFSTNPTRAHCPAKPALRERRRA